MTLIEAIKSGKEFKRPSWGIHVYIDDEGYACDPDDNMAVPLNLEDLEANDYILVEQEAVLTNEWFSRIEDSCTNIEVVRAIKELRERIESLEECLEDA